MKNLTLTLIILAVVVVFNPKNSSAQYAEDALRFSQSGLEYADPISSSMGGVGGLARSPGSVLTNPALSKSRNTIGLFGGWNSFEAENNFLNESKARKTSGNFGGFVGFEASDSLFLNFGVLKSANFSESLQFQGVPPEKNWLNYLAREADGIHFENLTENHLGGMAYFLHLIDPVDPQVKPDEYKPADSLSVFQTGSETRSGGISDIVASLSWESQTLAFGATVGFPQIRFSETFTFREESQTSGGYQFSEFEGRLDNRGSGVYGIFGLAIKPFPFITIGGSIKTPTYFYNMSGNYRFDLSGSSVKEGSNTFSSAFETDFQLVTPFRPTANIRLGLEETFLVASYSKIDHSSARMQSDQFSSFFEGENSQIERLGKKSEEIRLGGQVYLPTIPIYLRAGYFNLGAGQSGFSFGVGVSFNGVSFNAGYVKAGTENQRNFFDFPRFESTESSQIFSLGLSYQFEG